MKIWKAVLVTAALLAALPASAGAGELVWQPAEGRPCDQVCAGLGLRPLTSGVHAPGGKPTRDAFYICSANYNGFRPGYNLQPSWSKACFIPYGGKEVAAKDYRCGCQ
ncbi:hypothetical protein V5F49_13770 [Xanthobacter sp. V3C-3]|uniref:hypothetical protein n=1 Tax=Xanthobacter lutulentifluminis TaxID=3119935 RepID=UPI00372BAD0F